jgi:MFS family permease
MINNPQINTEPKVQKQFFYGYVIVSICFLFQVLMLGPRGSFGVIITPLTAEFNWTRAILSGVFSFSTIVQGSSSIIMGWLNDRLGPRVVLTVCGFLLGSGLILISVVNSIWQLYLFYAVLIGLGMGGIFSPQMSTIARWFVKRRNFMNGVLMAGGGLGGLIFPPLITWLIYVEGWRSVFLFLGIVVLVIIVLGAQFLRRDPFKIGQVTYGGSRETEINETETTGLSIKQSLQTKHFWVFASMIFCFGFCLMTIMVHVVPQAIDRGISASSAANILSAMNGAMTLGSIIVGLTSDRIGNWRVFIGCFCLLVTAVLLLLPVDSAWLLGFFVTMVAFGAGGIAVLESTMVAELFGMKSHGGILGYIYFIYTLGAALGPFTAGVIFDATDSYVWAFLLCTILSIIAIIMVISLKRIKVRNALLV